MCFGFFFVQKFFFFRMFFLQKLLLFLKGNSFFYFFRMVCVFSSKGFVFSNGSHPTNCSEGFFFSQCFMFFC